MIWRPDTTGGPRSGSALVTFAGSDDAAIPVERWGKDHWSTFAFVAEWCKTYGERGFKIRGKRHHMRTDPDLHPEFAVQVLFGVQVLALGCDNTGRGGLTPFPGGKKYPTRLSDGELEDHDDWSCLEDIEAVGLVRREGTGVDPILFMTDRGLVVSGELGAHKTRGGNYGDFRP